MKDVVFFTKKSKRAMCLRCAIKHIEETGETVLAATGWNRFTYTTSPYVDLPLPDCEVCHGKEAADETV